MFVDASAIVAILGNEPERGQLLGKLKRQSERTTSVPSVFEATLALSRSTGGCASALSEVSRFLEMAKIKVVPTGPDALPELAIAYDRYGRGRGNKAQLNFGDCFSYAHAKQAGVPLLFKGDDFALTDIAVA